MNLYDDFPPDGPDQAGQVLGELCAAKAEAVADWDRDGATRFILNYLYAHGPTSGEVLVTAASEWYAPHDGRAYGAVLGQLSRRGIIRKAGFCNRVQKGHGAPGAVIWQLAEAGG